MIKKLKVVGRAFLLVFMGVVLVVCDPTNMVLAAPHVGDEEHQGDQNYYANNGIIFYKGFELTCSSGATITGGAAGALQKQKGLDPEWVPIILNAAKEAGSDPMAMASLLFWENRGFPKIDAKWGGSDTIGRGPWQITKGTWPKGAGPYASGVIDPKISTPVAAQLVKNWGGEAGIPIGSIDQDFSKGKNIKSMATVAKNYNAGRATWREPGVAGFKASGRSWKQPSGTWFAQKQTIIDEYIMAMTYAYYLIATGQSLPKKGELDNDEFVKKAVQNADEIKKFKVGDGANVANECADGTAEGAGNVEATAKGLSWPNRKYAGINSKSAAKKTYQVAMPKVQGGDPGNDAWTDCGVFVATVMRSSGADPKYFLRGTGNQLAYMKRSPKKFKVEKFTNDSQLKPGDVLVYNSGNNGHTFIHGTRYKGDDGKSYDGYSASWHSRVPMANNTVGSIKSAGTTYWIGHPLSAENVTPTAGGTQ